MIIDCISDLHGYLPEMPGGDLLIVAGDLTARDTSSEHLEFVKWLKAQPYKRKVFIGGNHDNAVEKYGVPGSSGDSCFYLCDSGCEFEGLKIWGSPWTSAFVGQNPKAMAFTMNYGCDTDLWLAEKYQMIPKDTNILVTHNPSFGNLDRVKSHRNLMGTDASVGSVILWMMTLTCLPHLKLHVFGHVHESHGHVQHYNGIHLVNASYVNEKYEPVNKPIRIIL